MNHFDKDPLCNCSNYPNCLSSVECPKCQLKINVCEKEKELPYCMNCRFSFCFECCSEVICKNKEFGAGVTCTNSDCNWVNFYLLTE